MNGVVCGFMNFIDERKNFVGCIDLLYVLVGVVGIVINLISCFYFVKYVIERCFFNFN